MTQMSHILQLLGGGRAAPPMQSQPLNANAGLARVESFPLYDTVLLSSGTIAAQDLRFFAVPIGSIGSGYSPKTEVETNMDNAGRLADEVLFSGHALQVSVKPAEQDGAGNLDAAAVVDARRIMHNMAIQFTQPGFTRTYGPLDMYPGGGGLYTDLGGASGGVTPVFNIGNGLPTAMAGVRFKNPIMLGRGQTFGFVIKLVRPITLSWDWAIRVQLPGTQERRVVQA